MPKFACSLVVLTLLSVWGLISCSKSTATSGGAGETYIYISSGTIFAGNGVTVASASQTVTKYNADGTFNGVIADYADSPGDSPTDIIDFDSNYLLAIIDNAGGGRRLEKIAKDGSGRLGYIFNATALSAALIALSPAGDGGLLVSKTASVEKFTASKARVTQGANPFISAPGGSCATSTTRTAGITIGPSNTIILAHAAASANNQINLIGANGYSLVADCLAVQEGPTANHWPTAVHYHANSGKLFVAYANNTGPVHDIYTYDVTASSISNPVLAYQNASIVNGPTRITVDDSDNFYITNGTSTYNTVESFTYEGGVLVRQGTSPLISPSLYTRSPSGIVVAD